MSRSVEVHKQAVRKNFSFLKRTTLLYDLFAKAITLPQGEGFLIPICELHATDDKLIRKLARWRNENPHAFPIQLPASVARIKSWLRFELLDIEDRILFLVLDRHGNAIGHVGFSNAINDAMEMEIENVLLGVKNAQPGLLSHAVEALLNWAEETIGPHIIYLKVFQDNHHAIEFYHRLGFRDDGLLPLWRHKDGDNTSYLPVAENDQAPPDRYFLRLVYSPARKADGSFMILTAGPSISAREASYALDAACNGWNRQMDAYIKRFEAAFTEYVGTKYAISTSSCTGALHIALAALGIGPGDEVIVPDVTWVATANAVLYVGATPIFADIESDSWCLDPASFQAAISAHTKAVIPVHLYGHPARMDKIMEIARKHNLYVVEDAAPAIGAEFKGRKTGTFGDFAAFSFQGAKLVVTGEGGMLVTNNDELYAKAYTIWDQGRVPGTFWINQRGLKYKMSNIQAAIGLGQLERVDELIEAKRRIFTWYEEELRDVPEIDLFVECIWARSIYWMCSILLNRSARVTRDALREDLRKRGVDTRPVYPAISQYRIWPKQQETQTTARRVGDQGINLPSGVCLRREQVRYICSSIREILTG